MSAGTGGRRWRSWFGVAAGTSVVVLAMAAPAYADPGSSSTTPVAAPAAAAGLPGVPNPGIRPVLSGTFALPASVGGGLVLPALSGPAGQYDLLLREQAMLGQQMLRDKIAADQAHAAVAPAKAQWEAAETIVAGWRSQAADAVAASYREAATLSALGPFAAEYQGLAALAPGLRHRDLVAGQTTARDYLDALHTAQITQQAYDSALAADRAAAARYAADKRRYDQLTRQLATLKAANATAIAQANAAQSALEAREAAQLHIGSAAAGMGASPQAIAAVNFALSQVGKPYVWAAAGPNAYDCSGLVLASYQHAGVSTLPRVAADQYHATTPVPLSQLLPGDLLFYSSSPTDWRQIYHVVMYIGGGRVVEAPQPGDNVKVVGVFLTDFFGATRVVGAVPGGVTTVGSAAAPGTGGPAGPQVPPVTRPSPAPVPSTSPSAKPSTSPSGTPSTSPSGSPSPSQSPPSPSASPSASPSPSSPSPSSPAPLSPSATQPCAPPSPSPTATPSPSPSATPSCG